MADWSKIIGLNCKIIEFLLHIKNEEAMHNICVLHFSVQYASVCNFNFTDVFPMCALIFFFFKNLHIGL